MPEQEQSSEETRQPSSQCSVDITRIIQVISNGPPELFRSRREHILKLLRLARELTEEVVGDDLAIRRRMRSYLLLGSATSSCSGTQTDCPEPCGTSERDSDTRQPNEPHTTSSEESTRKEESYQSSEEFTKKQDGILRPGERVEVQISNTTLQDLVFGWYVQPVTPNERKFDEFGEKPHQPTGMPSTSGSDERASTPRFEREEKGSPPSSDANRDTEPPKPDPEENRAKRNTERKESGKSNFKNDQTSEETKIPPKPREKDDESRGGSSDDDDDGPGLPPPGPELDDVSLRDVSIEEKLQHLQYLRGIDQKYDIIKEAGVIAEDFGGIGAITMVRHLPGVLTASGDVFRDQFTPSLAHQNCTWKLVENKDGEDYYELVGETNIKPAYAGPSATYGVLGYDQNDRRPFKIIKINRNIKRTAYDIKHVDFELYGVLRMYMATRPVTKDTLAALRTEATKFMRNFKSSHLDALLVAEIMEATIFAAMVPTAGSLSRWSKHITHSAAMRTELWNSNIKDGIVPPKWWAFWRRDAKLYASTE